MTGGEDAGKQRSQVATHRKRSASAPTKLLLLLLAHLHTEIKVPSGLMQRNVHYEGVEHVNVTGAHSNKGVLGCEILEYGWEGAVIVLRPQGGALIHPSRRPSVVVCDITAGWRTSGEKLRRSMMPMT